MRLARPGLLVAALVAIAPDAPYVVERWTKVTGSELELYYVLSTWNPYVVVLMKSRLEVESTR